MDDENFLFLENEIESLLKLCPDPDKGDIHPNLLKMFHYFDESYGQWLYLVTEICKGSNLHKKL